MENSSAKRRRGTGQRVTFQFTLDTEEEKEAFKSKWNSFRVRLAPEGLGTAELDNLQLISKLFQIAEAHLESRAANLHFSSTGIGTYRPA